jgi:hypothetical protein
MIDNATRETDTVGERNDRTGGCQRDDCALMARTYNDPVRLLGWAVAVGLAGCGGQDVAPVGDAGAEAMQMPFSATADDFAGFTGWPALVLNGPPVVDAAMHTEGVRTVYLKAPPPPGAVAWPIGTVIVKTIVPNPAFPTAERVFAMTKRGRGFNSAGAVGWEWFELDPTQSPPMIVWRGLGPPVGDTYNGDASCNGCHVLAVSNDFVHSLQLSDY